MRSRTTVIVVGCVLAAVTLAGCKSSTTSAGGSGPTQPTAGQTSAAAGQPSAGAGQTSAAAGQPSAVAASSGGGGSTTADGLGHPVAVCSLLPVATVAQLSGEALTTAKEDDLPNAKSYTCAYTGAPGTSNVAVTVLAMNAATSYNAGIAAFGSEATQISGVGDKAYSAALGVVALFGNITIAVSGVGSNDDAVKIIQTLQPKL